MTPRNIAIGRLISVLPLENTARPRG